MHQRRSTWSPDFGPVQNNVSFNDAVGTTRGIHAEPWDKYISVAAGRVFGAWVDLREGESFGATFHIEIDPSVAERIEARFLQTRHKRAEPVSRLGNEMNFDFTSRRSSHADNGAIL